MAVCVAWDVEQSLPRFVRSTLLQSSSQPARVPRKLSPMKVPLREPAAVGLPKRGPFLTDMGGEPHGNAPDGCRQGIEAASEDDTRAVTTLMIRNIPCRCQEEEVLQAIAKFGCASVAEFFYMPVNSASLAKKNHGYAFIGFLDAHSAELFRQSIDGRSIFENRQSNKVISVVPARFQGWADTVENCNGRVHGPMLFSRSGATSFPRRIMRM